MAVLHNEYIKYNKEIKLTDSRKESLKTSRKELRKKVKNWFSENKPKELQPKFASQGSFEMNTIINPIPTYNSDGVKLIKYDLDDGIYFIEKDEEDNRKPIQTWHDWVFESVDKHTGEDSVRKTTCVRVVFADGHHIDLPIYYKKDDLIELAHRSKGWLESDPKAFYNWFNNLKNPQLERLVRYLKGWKDFRESNNASLKLPSGFELTILAVNSYVNDDNDDLAFRQLIKKMDEELNKPTGFKCLRPTNPVDEDLFADYSDSRKSNFLKALSDLVSQLESANSEKNFKKSSEIIRKNVFGERFPLGEDKDEETRINQLTQSIIASPVRPKPYGY